MNTVTINSLADKKVAQLIQRPSTKLDRLFPSTRQMFLKIKKEGDKALREYTKEFDGVELKNTAVSRKEILRALREVDSQTRAAFEIAAKNIETFHQAQQRKEKKTETMKGVICWREARPIEKVGLYIPRGLPSTVLMLGIPAKIAGCKEVILCTPPDRDGKVQKEILLAAEIVGVSNVFSIGGAQAIGAMAYGTRSVPRVYKIFGPGNQYVTAAKMLVSIDPKGAAIDLPAGPSEVLVIADERANANFVAADLLSQAEHGPDSPFILLTNSKKLAKETRHALQTQMQALPRKRKEALSASFEESRIVVTKSVEQALEFSNLYAPEHLILNVKRPKKYISRIKNAGSVFVGQWSPESAGDYASGTNHVLPTGGYAKSCGGVSLDSFLKYVTFQELSKTGIQNIAGVVERIAEVEELFAHKNAVTIRKGLTNLGKDA